LYFVHLFAGCVGTEHIKPASLPKGLEINRGSKITVNDADESLGNYTGLAVDQAVLYAVNLGGAIKLVARLEGSANGWGFDYYEPRGRSCPSTRVVTYAGLWCLPLLIDIALLVCARSGSRLLLRRVRVATGWLW
jgi:hypothetical protein